MDFMRDWLEQPIIPHVLPLAVMGALLLLALAALAGVFPRARDTAQAETTDRPEGFLARWFRTMRLAPGEGLVVRGVFAIFAVLFMMAIATAFVLVGGVLWHTVTAPAAATPSASLGLGALLVALLGAPFLIWRSVVAQRTLDTTRDGLVTDRINAAVASLGAEKTVKRPLRDTAGQPVCAKTEAGEPDPTKPVIEEITLPNMEVRIGAIHALGRIARENLNFHVQIMEILCAYVRENSPASSALPYQPPKSLVNDKDEALTPEAIKTYLAQLRSGLDTLRQTLPKPRTDIQTALEVLGRRTPDQKRREGGWPDPDRDAPCIFDQTFPLSPPHPDTPTPEARKAWRAKFAAFRKSADDLTEQFRTHRTYRHDLRNTNLQGYDLSHLDLRGARLGGVQMQGASLGGAQMQGADLGGAHLQGADLSGAQTQGADLGRARLQGAGLSGAHLQGARLSGAQMQGADLAGAQMQRTNLYRARMQGVNLAGAQMQGASLSGAQMQRTDLYEAQMQAASFYEAQMQGASLFWAQMQGADLSGAQMQWAYLVGAQMQGADLLRAQMSEDTNTSAAALRGALLRFVDDTTIARLRPHWDDIIAVLETLPEGAPDHWVQIAQDDFDYITFIPQWRAWAATLDPPATIAPDYRPD